MSELNERKEAKHIIDTVFGAEREDTAAIEDMEMLAPAIHLAKKALLLIEKQGGKVDASLIGMLSSAAMLQELLGNQTGISDEKRNGHEAAREAAMVMADELVNRDLVELPVVARGRGRG